MLGNKIMSIRNVNLIRGRNGTNGSNTSINDIYHLLIVSHNGIEFEKELSENDIENMRNGDGLKFQDLISRAKSSLLLEQEIDSGDNGNNRTNSVYHGIEEVNVLQNRIGSLETSLSKVQIDYNILQRDYKRLMRENIQLKLESGGYGRAMKLYSSYIENSQNEAYQTFGKIAKILSGYYHGTIDDIEQGKEEQQEKKKEDENTYLWRWEDRINAVKHIYRKNEAQIKSTVKDKYIEQLFKIISHNKYVTGRYSNKINELKSLLLH